MKKQAQLGANGKCKFGIRDSIAYAAGDLGCNTSFASMFMFAFHCIVRTTR